MEEDAMSREENMLYWELLDDLLLPPAPPAPVLPPPPQPVATRAFQPYGGGRTQPCSGSAGESMHKRVVEFLRLIPKQKQGARGSKENEATGSRCFRHMMKERQRRERQSQGYADLHSFVSPTSKADKISILQSSVLCLKQLKATESRLRQRNHELQALVARQGATLADSPNCIKLTVPNPASSFDSVIACLQRIKQMDVRTKSIHATFIAGEWSVVIEIDTEVYVPAG